MLARRLIHRFSQKNLEVIQDLLNKNIKADFLEVVDESARHYEATDSHFKITVVSDEFAGLSIIKRHRKIMDLLKANQIMDKIHAVNIEARTVEEIQSQAKK